MMPATYEDHIRAYAQATRERINAENARLAAEQAFDRAMTKETEARNALRAYDLARVAEVLEQNQ